MEYNWADPRKNSRVDSFMMAKTEALRVKRLTSVKATVSNQLHPAAEHKLKVSKKKKSQEIDSRPSSRLHQRESDLDNNSSNQHSGGSSFYNEFLPHAAKPAQSVFDGFDVHAAADGLFHPASNIQAFAEHDAKYATRDSTTRSGRLSTRSTNTNHNISSRTSTESDDRKLPPLSGKSDRSARLASRSDSRLPVSSSSSSNLSVNRSDSDLHAPRRRGIVPSTADRDAMDLLHELDHEEADFEDLSHHDDEPQTSSPVPFTNLKSEQRTRGEENNNNEECPPVVPGIELDLTQKFEKLKLMMKTSRDIATHRSVEDASRPEVDEETDTKMREVSTVPSKKQPSTEKVNQAMTTKKELTKVNTSSVEEKKKKMMKALDVHTEAQKGPITTNNKTKLSTNELKTRTGVSLSDLKEEHRAALAMLQELGGPIDVDYESQDTITKKSGVAKRTKVTSQTAKGTAKTTIITAKPPNRSERPNGSADRAARLVDKLRSQIPSEREKRHDELASTAGELQGRELITAALDAARQVLDKESMNCSRISADADKDEELWRRYQGGEEPDEDDDDDPSAELYEDEQFES